ncbi:MAG: hypothetical protein HUU38_18175 [Anaerolineales bacterium]|jgi:hypothetical protein|nr:hypothetical protein [Anaerolineales bacterium]
MFEINDSDLLMYLDGVADPSIKAEIERDNAYHGRIQELKKQQHQWISRLYRIACPESLVLGEFHLGRLSPKYKKAIESHLGSCVHCVRELAELASYLGTEPIVSTVVDEVVQIFAQLIFRKTSADALGVVRGVRGGGKSSSAYEAGGAQIVLEVKDDEENPGFQALMGIITGVEAETYEVSLWQAGVKVDGAQINELGGFTIGNLESGEYQLIIHGPKVDIHVQSFVV